MSVVKVR